MNKYFLVSFAALFFAGSSQACTLGHQKCVKNIVWNCEACASETCWMISNTSCGKILESDTEQEASADQFDFTYVESR